MSAGKFLAGFVVGGVVGAVVGLLLAPQSGQETRDMLARNSEELKNKAEKTVKEIQGKAEDLVSDMQKTYRQHVLIMPFQFVSFHMSSLVQACFGLQILCKS